MICTRYHLDSPDDDNGSTLRVSVVTVAKKPRIQVVLPEPLNEFLEELAKNVVKASAPRRAGSLSVTSRTLSHVPGETTNWRRKSQTHREDDEAGYERSSLTHLSITCQPASIAGPMMSLVWVAYLLTCEAPTARPTCGPGCAH